MDRPRTGRTVSIPDALETDSGDVRDALTTAHAMWQSGDRGEALRWLRRAAEVATDAGDDARALQLFKATSLIGSLRPPPADPSKPPPAVSIPRAAPLPSTPAEPSEPPPPAAAREQ